jgi:hypothetical protein
MATPQNDAYLELRRSIEEEKERRIREHQAQVAARSRCELPWGTPPPRLSICSPRATAGSTIPFRYLRPVTSSLTCSSCPGKKPLVCSLAHHGEAAEDMLGVKKLHELIDQINNPRLNGHYDAILFSGGGNDIAGDQFRLWLNEAAAVGNDPAQGLNADRVAAIIAVIKAGYEDLIAARDAIDKTIPIFGHSYDFPIPNGVRVPCAGPWLRPGFQDRGWTDVNVNRGIIKQLLLQLAAMLDVFAGDAKKNFVHVRTQGTLIDTDWDNELHPTPDGFAAITAKFVEALRHHFGADRI